MIQNLASGVRAFTSNVFLVTGETTALVDAGANFDVVARIEAHVDELDRVYLTHTHPDHVKNLPAIREAFDVETWGYDPENEYVDNAIADGETVQIGDDDYVALHTPGHKPDHLCLYAREAGICFAGDLVFENGGFGRTDLEGGDRETLIRSIDALLDVLDDDLAALHVGHGPSITERPIDDVELAARAARM
ncbi:MBL fold metallo-hydrolase [Halobellus sp. H-GB7]|uniref:MBL fold metallo-hydrolase n=1 Tax=Halobellus sp. H-GB7 TaxID=3069756 RepID=UPI0027ADAEF9|nr:MBL fold metallo-hydrolase [Halobellus sp. H-GB7]MDQ2053642.1 MBL fold metallo-hydrolase [Halobellus sp. H-GB7]